MWKEFDRRATLLQQAEEAAKERGIERRRELAGMPDSVMAFAEGRTHNMTPGNSNE